MTPERRILIGDQEISEYHSAGEVLVHVNKQPVQQTYEEACKAAHVRFNEQFWRKVDGAGPA